jgi:hypothetical protein
MNHDEIRFNILRILYQKHYGGELKQLQTTDEIIQEAGLGNIDKNVAAGDIVYLEDKNLINGTTPLGHAYPPWISITSSGIDFVEVVINTFVKDVEITQVTEKVKSDVRELAQEGNRSKKIKSIVDYAQTVTALWLNIINIVSRLQGHI